MPLKPPVVALLISPDRYMRDAIHRKTKEITIREGHRDYKPGQLLALFCQLEPWAVMADITEVRHCTLREVTVEEYLRDGFANIEDMLAGMRRFYKNMTLDSPVTIIHWENAQGYWVNNPDEYLKQFPLDEMPDIRPS